MILEYNPQIYPTRLWVSHYGTTAEEYNNTFRFFDMEDNVGEYNEERDGYAKNASRNACVYVVAHKKSNWKGILVEIDRKMEGDIYAHEAVHACNWLFESLGIKCATLDDDEPRAYYVEWAVRKIMAAVREFRKNKIRLAPGYSRDD